MNQLPRVLMNMAISADGKIATASRRVSSFGGPRDVAHLYELRASADAILSGARTVNEEEVTLGPGPAKYRRLRARLGYTAAPLRVVATGSGRLNPDARLFRKPGAPIIILTTRRAGPDRLLRLREMADDVAVFGRDSLDFAAALAWLAEEYQVRRVLVEGGGELNSALFRAGLVNELHLTVCPWVFGGRAAPTIADGEPPASLSAAAVCRLRSRKRSGTDLFLVYDVLPPAPRT